MKKSYVMCVVDQFHSVMTCSTFKSIPFKKKKDKKKNEKNIGSRSLEAETKKVSNSIEKTVIGASNLHIFRKKLVARVRHNSSEYSLCV